MTVDMTVLDVLSCCRPLGTPALADDEAAATATLFKALSDPARVKIVNLLATSPGPVCACEFEPGGGRAPAAGRHPPNKRNHPRQGRSTLRRSPAWPRSPNFRR